jgi:probable rRNA maturation factor
MKILVINQSSVRAPRKFIDTWCAQIQKEFLKRKVFNKAHAQKELTVVFLNPKEAKKTNKQFRGKDYATDVLSFDGMSPEHLGDLVMCPQVLKKQAKEHGLSYQEELGYMLLHGILHLLGYDHELGQKEAEEMFGLQDAVFAKLLD